MLILEVDGDVSRQREVGPPRQRYHILNSLVLVRTLVAFHAGTTVQKSHLKCT